MYRVHITLIQTSRWHQNNSLVWGPCTKMQPLFWCQREVWQNPNGHPVHFANVIAKANGPFFHLQRKPRGSSLCQSFIVFALKLDPKADGTLLDIAAKSVVRLCTHSALQYLTGIVEVLNPLIWLLCIAIFDYSIIIAIGYKRWKITIWANCCLPASRPTT